MRGQNCVFVIKLPLWQLLVASALQPSIDLVRHGSLDSNLQTHIVCVNTVKIAAYVGLHNIALKSILSELS